jgi:hypothetical protein
MVGSAPTISIICKDGPGNPNHVPPGCREGGEFCSAGAAGGISAQESAKIVEHAKDWAGTPYAPRGTERAGDKAVKGENGSADCSGSVHAIYGEAGYNYTYAFSGSFAADAKNGSIPFKEVTANERQAGDVVLYDGHMSVYAGDGKVWSAHQTGVKFQFGSVSDFGKPRYFRYQSSDTKGGK